VNPPARFRGHDSGEIAKLALMGSSLEQAFSGS
jgi:hypothetical protein